MIKKFFNWLNCLTGMHDWTCKADQGIKPTQQELDAGVAGFNSYAQMYCKRCGEVYQP